MRTKTPQQAEKMLNAAARLFAGEHFHKVRMEDIAAEAAVGKGTIYRYFEDKEELYLALLDRASKQVQERTRRELDRYVGTRAKLAGIARAILEFHDEQPHIVHLIQRAEATRGAASPWQEARDVVTGWCRQVFEQAITDEEFKVRDLDFVAYQFLGVVRAAVLSGRRPRPVGLAVDLVADFLDGAAQR